MKKAIGKSLISLEGRLLGLTPSACKILSFGSYGNCKFQILFEIALRNS